MIGIAVILVSVIADGLADATFHKLPWHKGYWWDWWHWFKRIRLCLPPVYILYMLGLPWWQTVLVIVGSWVAWQVGMRIGGKKWTSMWLGWLR